MNGIDDMKSSDFFEFSVGGRTRGHKFKMMKKHVKSKVRQCSFSQRVISEWNKLPSFVIDSPSVNSFKSNLERFWSQDKNKYNPDGIFFCPCYTAQRLTKSY